jgi:purine-nucleoside phosphorylase|tara:strand:+ start:2865 stop:3608 length:744 start_codon:yes stop_codon:yes gene_type:complete
MTPHIEAQPGDYADTVLLPGDPLRAKWIAETFFDHPVQVNSVRNCFGYTGEYQGERISVQAGGMGMPSNSIYITELFKDYNVKTIIRVGSCGGIAKHIKVGDIVAATTATTDSAMGKTLIPGFQYSPSVDYDLLTRFMAVCPEAHVGGITSNDYFYQPNQDWWRDHQKYGILAVEMETYMLYTLAAQYKRKALSVNTVSDHFEPVSKTEPFDSDIGMIPGMEINNKTMSPKEREQGFTKMIESVLKI